ncbi:MAG: GNAT family N-acetyltransferase [Acidobacteriota bacterium]|nr:GNAT family N-acetyltransferase [Acidobacteriota bacterium]
MAATVRRLGPEEWPLLRTVRLHALRDAPLAFGSSFEDEVTRPDDWWTASTSTLAWFVAEADGGEGGGGAGELGAVGLAAGWPGTEPGGCPEVISMWVAGSWRGRGVADELLAAVIGWAVTTGAPALCLAVADGNDRARRFYERAGFRSTGRSEPLRSRPAVCTWEMRLALTGDAGERIAGRDGDGEAG